MTKEVRQGAALLCVALVFLVVSLATTGPASDTMRAVAMLFGIAGLALAAFGLFRSA